MHNHNFLTADGPKSKEKNKEPMIIPRRRWRRSQVGVGRERLEEAQAAGDGDAETTRHGDGMGGDEGSHKKPRRGLS